MATEKVREIRDWFNFGLTVVSVLIIPIGLVILKNQRLEIRDEMRQTYVPLTLYQAQLSASEAKINVMSAKLDTLTVQIARLMDATKLREQ